MAGGTAFYPVPLCQRCRSRHGVTPVFGLWRGVLPVACLPVYPFWRVCYGSFPVLPFIVIAINQLNKTKMESLNKNGVSITQTPEEEKYIECCLGAFRGQIYIQYDYRHTNGKLFSTVAKTLEICRQQRDEWIKRQSNHPFTSYFRRTYTKPNRAGFASVFTPAKNELLKRQRKTTSTPIGRRS